MPCNNLPKIYGFIEISDLEIILNTCNIIEIPPKPSKKAQIIILIARFLLATQETAVIPFVNSKIPVRIGAIKSVLILNKLKQGTSKFFDIFRI